MWSRIIAHADMDAFFASVEMRDDPRLSRVPLIIGHPGPRSVVCTANYLARKFHVHSAMPMTTALRLCPQAVVIPPRMERYLQVSHQIMQIFSEFTACIEPLSCDEAFLDLSDAIGLFPGPRLLGQAIKRKVFQETGLTVSVGMGNTKLVAKLASDHQKPDGLTIVPPSEAVDFIAPLPIQRLWGAGPKTAAKLESLGIRQIGDLTRRSPTYLSKIFGQSGFQFYAFAHNCDPREVITEREAKSIGVERTLWSDIEGYPAVFEALLPLCEELHQRLQRAHAQAGGLRIKLKTSHFQLHSRQMALPVNPKNPEEYSKLTSILLKEFLFDEPIRLIGLAAYDLNLEHHPRQLPLPHSESWILQ